ncbi:MAG: hypothetical protein OXJ52_07425, partial [Oligoflexia bacterium]|nr:hypothetical protein [Oligoflexia bacterium]
YYPCRIWPSKFEKTLNKKFSELIENSWSNDKTIKDRRKHIKTSREQIIKTISDFDTIYKNHIQSIEDKIKPKDHYHFLTKR